MIQRIIIAGGGTGGHLFPGIAVLQEMRRRNPELEVLFVGTSRGIEARVVPAMGEQLECIEVSPLKGRSVGQLAKSLAALPQAGFSALSILKRFAPDLVLGVGGYAAGPMVAAAAASGIPCALLEQNAHVGLTNRLLARIVGRAYLSYENTLRQFPTSVARFVGNPVRRDFVQAGRLAQMDPAAFEMRARRILVIGGSQGAQVLNETLPEALRGLDLARRGIRVTHQTGSAMCETVAARYRELGVPADVVPFIDDMAAAYRSAALVVARAGATTLAELCTIGRPSVLVPYPFAADDHQWHNARVLEEAGAAVAIRQTDLDAGKMAAAVASVLDDPARRASMGDAARSLGHPDAAASIVDDLCEWLGCQGERPEPTDSPDDGEAESAADSGAGTSAAHYATASSRRAGGRRRRTPVRRSFAWDHGDRYFGTRSIAVAE